MRCVDVIDSLEKGEKVEKTKYKQNYLEEIKRTNFRSTEYVKYQKDVITIVHIVLFLDYQEI